MASTFSLPSIKIETDLNDESSPSAVSCRRSLLPAFLPPAKRIKLDNKSSNRIDIRNSIINYEKYNLEHLKNVYYENLTEQFFLLHNGNLVDLQLWAKKFPSQLIEYLKHNKLLDDLSLEKRFSRATSPINTNLNNNDQSSYKQLSLLKANKYENTTLIGRVRQTLASDASLSSGQQDQIVEKAKQEVSVIQRVSALRKDGLWGEKRLPKVQEPPRSKAHWDYLLEEMVWLSADFSQERKWKKAAAKKCAKMVQKYFQDKTLLQQRIEKEQEMKLKKMASFVAKEIRIFWHNIEKIIEYKVNTRLDEKKKIALDQHLNFMVDQTEKYSTMLAESMKRTTEYHSNINSEASRSTEVSDEEFEPDDLSDDDEGTIGKEDDNPEDQESELKLLQQESEQTIDDLIYSLPKEYVASQDEKSISSEKTDKSEIDSDPDEEFIANESGEDDEATINEQEEMEETSNYDKEIEELEDENKLTVEEIKAKYDKIAAATEVESMDVDVISDITNDISRTDGTLTPVEDDASISNLEDAILSDNDEGLGLQDLIGSSFEKGSSENSPEMRGEDLEEATAVAESLQPSGFTLSSTSVTTPIPFLLKHTLREYQHVGLDWLVTMYEKGLNGILADEMGLGKTIQTIALLAHLACEKKSWGPHLIVVPTSVMLNWEMEFKKWCPAFKILTYYGSQKERRLKRQGWTKQNAFHVCITSYKLVIQDHQSFRRKKWCYFILDEAQNIKNFKSQRWQLLLNFQSRRRLLLTGTPLQNNLMELWSLMHFLRSDLFASHRDFKELFSNPVTGMIEGNKEYNSTIIKKLHKVLRPFILRRLKSEVEQQMPKKYEHIVMCRLSKRQRFLYEEFMSRTKTKETLASGNFLSVINILMQLRKVCNHPNLFESRPIISPLMMDSIIYECPSVVWGICDYNPFKHINLFSLNLMLNYLERCLTAFAAHRMRRFKVPPKLIEEIDSAPEPPPRCPSGRIRLHVRPSSQPIPRPGMMAMGQRSATPVLTLKTVNQQQQPSANSIVTSQSSQWPAGVRFQLVQYGGTYKAIPLPAGSTGGVVMQSTPQGPRFVMPHKQLPVAPTVTNSTSGATPLAGTVSVANNTSAVSTASGGLGSLQLVQTSVGNYLLTSAPIQKSANNSTTASVGVNSNTAMALLQRLQSLKGLQGSVITTGAGGRPVLRLPTSPLRPTSTVNSLSSTSIPSPVATTKVTTGLQATQQNTHVKVSSAPLQSTLTYSTVGTPNLLQSNKQENQIEDSKVKSESSKSVFYMAELEEARKDKRKEKLKFLAMCNTQHCHACPIYGQDLMDAVRIILSGSNSVASIYGIRSGQGLIYSRFTPYSCVKDYWIQTNSLERIINTPLRHLYNCKDILDQFLFCVPPALAPRPSLRLHHPCPSKIWKEKSLENNFKSGVRDLMKPLHSITTATLTQFPDPRLIQYDCGKLQTLNMLLRKLKTGSHRVLIFTQMTRMLDVFEAFLNYHGHLYLRLDGTTKVEQRQILMERFNQDKRIFVFILSTRSGGIGVNLTGADTVIFYDSDWNPTMDAQAQDRCHRIGQTRDVHIYRLISERTVEENILKKANQKKLLGDLAIEGGNFTTAQLKKQTIHDLFEVDLQEQDALKRMSEVIVSSKEEGSDEGTKMGAYENALAAAEDESDVQAANTAKAEVAAHLAEFDENIPIDEGEEEVSKVEHELANLMKQLNPIEKYAMKFLESSDGALAAEADRLAAEIEQQKKEWEQNRLNVLREEEELRLHESGDEQLTYSSHDARNQVWLSDDSEMVMNVWQPLTPPRNENDLYIDENMVQWYESLPMEDLSLPSVYMPRESNKRIKLDPEILGGSSVENSIRMVQKRNGNDSVATPRSLFEIPPSSFYNRSDKVQVVSRAHFSSLKASGLMSKLGDSETYKGSMQEDSLIVTSVSMVEKMQNASAMSTYCPTNWDLIADMSNIIYYLYRSSRSTRNRFEVMMASKDEKEQDSKKSAKKQKTLMRVNSGGLSTDSNAKFMKMAVSRLTITKDLAVVKPSSSKTLFANTNSKNKQSTILQDYGISVDDPLTPKAIAFNRAERLKKLEQKADLQNRTAQQTQAQTTGQQQITDTTVNSQSLGGSSTFGSKTVAHLVGDGSSLTTGSNSPNPSNVISTATTTILSNVRATVTGQAGQGGRTTLTFQDLQGRTGTSQATVVSLAQLQAAKLSGTLITQAVHQKGVAVPVQARALTPQQIQLLRQQAQRQTIALQSTKVVSTSTTGDGQMIKRVQIAGQSGSNQKLQVAVSAGGIPGITAIQVSQPGRAQLIKSGSVVAVTGPSSSTGKSVTRTVTESEMNALLRRQPHQISKAGNLAQMLAKQRPLVNMKGATAGIIGSKMGVPSGTLGTVQIVQGSAQKHMTVQQLQQVLKQSSLSGTIIGKAVVSGAATSTSSTACSQTSSIVQATLSSSPTTKLIPMSVSPQPQNIKQTIQVVSAGTSAANTSNTVRITATDRPAGLTLQGNTVRVANPALLSQVSAALQGPISMGVRSPGTNAVRIETAPTQNPQNGGNQQQFNQ